jgi:large subunit ribosomal protein L28
MAGKCDICGKGPQFGHNVSHSKQRTKRRWKPNLQTVTIQDGDTMRRVSICTRCLRTLQKD